MPNKISRVRTRFAPSPTGNPHVGNIRTALFAWLFAKNQGGAFILRVEDTDQERSVSGSVANILDSLDWLGLTVDEGVIGTDKESGKHGPYFQSKRLAIYKKHAQELIEKGHAYACFCAPERLVRLRQAQEKAKQPPRYDGHCLELSAGETTKRLNAGEAHVIRLKIPAAGETVFEDVVKGRIAVSNHAIDHQVLIKSDGFPTYHLASVVDDHLMAITHVIRADEWLPSTPKHVLLYEYFGWAPPVFVHLPIILGTDKSKLSKRHGAVSLLEYREQGYLPAAMVNYLSLLGWNPKTDQEIFSVVELVKLFDLKKINKAAAVFDLEKLRWLNARHIRALPAAELTALLGSDADEGSVNLVQDRLVTLRDYGDLTGFLREYPEPAPELLLGKGQTQAQAKAMLELGLDIAEAAAKWDEDILRQTFFDYCEKTALKKSELLWPLRAAVTGLKNSPDVFGSLAVLGRKESIRRIKAAIGKLGNPKS